VPAPAQVLVLVLVLVLVQLQVPVPVQVQVRVPVQVLVQVPAPAQVQVLVLVRVMQLQVQVLVLVRVPVLVQVPAPVQVQVQVQVRVPVQVQVQVLVLVLVLVRLLPPPPLPLPVRQPGLAQLLPAHWPPAEQGGLCPQKSVLHVPSVPRSGPHGPGRPCTAARLAGRPLPWQCQWARQFVGPEGACPWRPSKQLSVRSQGSGSVSPLGPASPPAAAWWSCPGVAPPACCMHGTWKKRVGMGDKGGGGGGGGGGK